MTCIMCCSSRTNSRRDTTRPDLFPALLVICVLITTACNSNRLVYFDWYCKKVRNKYNNSHIDTNSNQSAAADPILRYDNNNNTMTRRRCRLYPHAHAIPIDWFTLIDIIKRYVINTKQPYQYKLKSERKGRPHHTVLNLLPGVPLVPNEICGWWAI